MNADDFSKFVLEMAEKLGPPGPFKPHWWYNKEGDILEVYWSEEAYVAKWINRDLTLLVSHEDPNKIIGVIIEGVKRGIERDGGLRGT